MFNKVFLQNVCILSYKPKRIVLLNGSESQKQPFVRWITEPKTTFCYKTVTP